MKKIRDKAYWDKKLRNKPPQPQERVIGEVTEGNIHFVMVDKSGGDLDIKFGGLTINKKSFK
jgi:hypothetical protein